MTLTVGEMRDALDSVKYKADWWFSIEEDRWEGPHLVIAVLAENAYDPSEKVNLRIVSAIPPIRDLAGFHSWIMWRLGRIELHEMREFYRIDGQPYDDPHRNFV